MHSDVPGGELRSRFVNAPVHGIGTEPQEADVRADAQHAVVAQGCLEGQWNLGRDVGSSSAEYRLDRYDAATATWRSAEGVYLAYDAAAKRLRLFDGSFWVMDCEAAANEPDAGTLYPTIMQDTAGNRIRIEYMQGAGGFGLWNPAESNHDSWLKEIAIPG